LAGGRRGVVSIFRQPPRIAISLALSLVPGVCGSSRIPGACSPTGGDLTAHEIYLADEQRCLDHADFLGGEETNGTPFTGNSAAALEDARIAIELDGAQHFENRDAYRRDRRKDQLLQESGYFFAALPCRGRRKESRCGARHGALGTFAFLADAIKNKVFTTLEDE
jgi:hypothetical protein